RPIRCLAAVARNRLHFHIRRSAHTNSRNPLQHFRQLQTRRRPAAVRTSMRSRAGFVLFHNETQFPAPFADACTNSPALPNLTVNLVPRITCDPASTDCSNATPLPINEGTSPNLEQASITLRTVCPARFGTTTTPSSSPNAIVGAAV